MSSARIKKPSKARGPAAMIAEADAFRARKEESFSLHDEADLVNFRADALNRYITNQDLLDNVVSRLVHASRLVPPRSFPGNGNGNAGAGAEIYPKTATDDELLAVVENLKVGQLFSGDLRLMRAKQQVSARDLAALESENLGVDVLSEETQFQKSAVDALAAAYARCGDAETVSELENVMDRTLKEYETRFSRTCKSESRQPHKHTISVRDLAPEVVVTQAPANYDPRSINTYINFKANTSSEVAGVNAGAVSTGISTTNNGGGSSSSSGINPGPTAADGLSANTNNNVEAEFSGPNAYIETGGDDYNDFGMLSDDAGEGGASGDGEGDIKGDNITGNDDGQTHEDMPFDPQLGQTQPGDGVRDKPAEEAPAESADVDADAGVDMDDIDQFLADPDAGDDGMDGMLMDFEHGNEDEPVMQFEQQANDEHAEIDEDPFNVDFLSSMGNGME